MEQPAARPPLNKDALLEALAPTIEKVAYNILRHKPVNGSYDRFDLMQEGMMAAFFAIDRYDPEREVDINAYLTFCAKGQMQRFIRDKASVVKIPRPVYELGTKLMRELDMSDRKGSYDRFDEMMEKYGVSRKKMKEAYEHIFLRMLPVSFDKKVTDDEKAGLYDFYYEDSYDIEYADRIGHIRRRLERFSERDQSIFLTALSGLNQKDIGKAHNVSQMHVSRIVRKIQSALIEENQQYDKDGDAI